MLVKTFFNKVYKAIDNMTQGMKVRIKKETVKRLHDFCQRGEKHDGLINRLLDLCETEEKEINLSDETVDRLVNATGCSEIDEALNFIMDKCRKILK